MIDYAKTNVPSDYRCHTCNVTNCKLWRDSANHTPPPSLRCCDCASKESKRDIGGIDDSGRHPSSWGRTDQIGWFLPAVPSPDNKSFYSYTSVPDASAAWWRALPTRSR